jgi:hypothetical protein
MKQKGLNSTGNPSRIQHCSGLLLTLRPKYLTRLEKLFVILLYALSYDHSIAQDTVKTFAAYQFTIPGSSFQSKMVAVRAVAF